MSLNTRKKTAVLYSILTGLLVGTSYIPFPPWAILFAYVPLWLCWLGEKSLLRIFWTGWVAQFVFTLIGFNWVAYTVHEFGHLPWFAALGTLFLFLRAGEYQLAFERVGVGRVLPQIARGSAWENLVLVIIMCASERIFPMIFDWHFGYTWLWAGLPGFQLADIIGFIGLANFGFVCHGLFLMALEARREKRSWGYTAVAPIALFLGLNLLGYWHGRNLAKADARMKVLIVQPNIGNQEKLEAEQGSAFRDTVLGRFNDLTVKALHETAAVDFAIWPETAFPEIIAEPNLSNGFARKLKADIVQFQTKLITGGYSRQLVTGRITNSFFILDEKGEWLAPPYHKTILLAFGEYMPFGDWMPWLRRTFPEVGDFGRGPGPTVMQVNSNKIGPLICYEGLFDWFARDLAKQGAQILVNLTNDSWYGKWEQPFQHGYMTLARAVEVRRPLVRSTNTGISTVVLASGEIMALSPLHEEWFHSYEVPYTINPQSTIFMTWGYWLIPGLLLLGMALIATRSRKRQ